MSANDSRGTQMFNVQTPFPPTDLNLLLLNTALSLRGRFITRSPHPAEQQEAASSRSSIPLRSIGAGYASRKTHGRASTAIDAFFFNDPYFPRPLSLNAHEQEIWDAFSNAYLKTGEEILVAKQDQEIKKMPARFIQMYYKGATEARGNEGGSRKATDGSASILSR